MRMIVLMFALCAACSSQLPRERETSEAVANGFATQLTAPAPDYGDLLKQTPLITSKPEQRVGKLPPPANARAIGEAWLARLRERGALLGYGLAGPGGPVTSIDAGLTGPEFSQWVEEKGWSVPGHIHWSFVSEMTLPRVSEAAEGAIRMWPASTVRTGAQNQALYRGRVELRDGCFYAGEPGQRAEKLAWFHAEMGLDVDADGYFILRDRVSGQTLARLGEDMSWGGPASAVIDQEGERALRQACGSGQILIVGSRNRLSAS